MFLAHASSEGRLIIEVQVPRGNEWSAARRIYPPTVGRALLAAAAAAATTAALPIRRVNERERERERERGGERGASQEVRHSLKEDERGLASFAAEEEKAVTSPGGLFTRIPPPLSASGSDDDDDTTALQSVSSAGRPLTLTDVSSEEGPISHFALGRAGERAGGWAAGSGEKDRATGRQCGSQPSGLGDDEGMSGVGGAAFCLHDDASILLLALFSLPFSSCSTGNATSFPDGQIELGLRRHRTFANRLILRNPHPASHSLLRIQLWPGVL